MVDINKLYEILVTAAQAEKTVSYCEIARVLRIDGESPQGRMQISGYLDEISCSENAKGRPLLSAVAVLPEIGYPARGFFLLARELGLNLCCDERSYFSYELKRVFEHWRKPVTEYQAPIYFPQPARSDRTSVAVH